MRECLDLEILIFREVVLTEPSNDTPFDDEDPVEMKALEELALTDIFWRGQCTLQSFLSKISAPNLKILETDSGRSEVDHSTGKDVLELYLASL